MGILRFLLALSVIIGHCDSGWAFRFLPGDIAVEAFFIISGFYMALVLNEKYFKVQNYYKIFITNRLLRLYPMYWAVLLIILATCLVNGALNGQYGNLQVYLDYWHKLKPSTLAYLITSNITIVGQDAFFFLTNSHDGGLQYTANTFSSTLVLYRFLFDFPLWTVSLEIMFYVISPFFVRMGIKTLTFIALLLLLARVIVKLYGVPYDPFIYRFFPLQLVFFLIGIITYQFYNKLKAIEMPKAVSYGCMVYILIFTAIFGRIVDSEVKDFIYLLSIACVVPVLFKLSRSSKSDRWIGELSYPMYISHILIILIVRGALQHFHIDGKYSVIIVVFVTLCFSIILLSLIGKRVENYRAKRIIKEPKSS